MRKWSSNLAYAIGLIASDGSLHKDGRHIFFSSKDFELISKFKESLELNGKIGRYARGGETDKRYFYLSFSDKVFYQFLSSIGLTAAKSKTIQAVNVPNEFFPDFLRGLFDGDGSFYSFRDVRWPNSFGFKTAIASASPDFVAWLKSKLSELYGVKGYIHKGAGVHNLEYVKGDSKKLFEVMYYSPRNLFLNRKYNKMKAAFKLDTQYGVPTLQKQRAAVA